MEQLKYIIEDEVLAKVLGVQNFTNKEAAVLELVKNAYDAYATKLEIVFDKNEIIVKDNGQGFSYSDIKNKWMHVGKSDRGQFNDGDRVAAGSKGIGRFALARLGENVKLYSLKIDTTTAIVWSTNWKMSNLAYTSNFNEIGTLIVISNLRDNWNEAQLKKLSNYLSRAYNDNRMEIIVKSKKSNLRVEKYFSTYNLGVNCVSNIEIKYDSSDCSIICNIYSDEFSDDAKSICSKNINFFSKIIEMKEFYSHFQDAFESKEEFYKALKQLGSFEGNLYFGLSENRSVDWEKFLYKYKVIPEKYGNGVCLYRNAFSISSYEGNKDWLSLGKRARLSPAAASHPTGSWRVRENQLSGFVSIDKYRNSKLEDLSNRQGIQEDVYYDIFIKIMHLSISEFERYRQSLIREIIAVTWQNKEKNADLMELILSKPELIKKFNDSEIIKFVTQISELKKDSDNAKQEQRNTEEKFRYDVRILNVLSTLGLKASSIAHELNNDRSSIENNVIYIIERLKQLDLWKIVDYEPNKLYVSESIPELLSQNHNTNLKMVSFIDTMLYKIEMSQFTRIYQDIILIIEKNIEDWKREYAWVDFKFEKKEELFCIISSDTLNVILDNLVLNSIQQNNNLNNLTITISIENIDETINIVYHDNGKGLDKKYIEDPFIILEVHETSRKNGHGLGMWILNSTLNSLGGKVTKILSDQGFQIEFTIGGKI